MQTDDSQDRVAAGGWEAINSSLRPVYGDQQPKHYGTLIRYRLGGPDPLDGISAYPRSDPVPHWHLITFGFSELYTKETNDPGTSGYGFELTMRLARAADEFEPPMWVLNFLQNLARYVFKTGNAFRSGDHMNLNGPIALGNKTLISAIAFMHDPELPPIVTSNGALEFLEVVGLTSDEYAAALAWNAERLLALIVHYLPLGMTELGRSSLLDVASFAQAVERGAREDGSSTGVLLLADLAFEVRRRLLGSLRAEISLSANSVPVIARVLSARFNKGLGLGLSSARVFVGLEPAESAAWSVEGSERLIVQLPVSLARMLAAALNPRAGLVTVPGLLGISIRINPTSIRDPK